MLPRAEIKRRLEQILESFNNNYMKRMHRFKVSACIKYRNNKKLYPIRVGHDKAERNPQAEKVDQSFVYQSLNMPGKKKRYIYVKNVQNPDKYEQDAIEPNLVKVQDRAKGKYNSFIAIPIRAGKKVNVSEDFATTPDLGMIGFDLNEKFGFGNFEENELHYIACFADLISEIVQDIAEANT
jgi:hypothetical protein